MWIQRIAIFAAFLTLAAGNAYGQTMVVTEEEVAWQRYFFEVGYSLTGASAHPGMRAASLPPLLNPGDNPQFDGFPLNDAYIPSGMGSCDVSAEEYCVRVNRPGLTFAHGLHLGFGAFITPRWGLSARVRFAPAPRDGGTMKNVVVGLRGHYKLTRPRNVGFHSSVFVGAMAGQIQVRPQQTPTGLAAEIERPWAQTGLGGAELGVKLGYRFHPNVGVFASPEVYVMFPEVSMGLQVTAGLDFAFGPVREMRERIVPAPYVAPEPVDEATPDAAPEEDPGPRVAGFTEQPDGSLRHDTPVLFALNSSDLDPNSYARLDQIAEAMNEDDALLELRVIGHADERGPDGLNQDLSEARAESVKGYLVERGGVDASRIRTAGRGANEPLVPNADTDRGHEENRRVELYLRVR